MSGYFSEGQLVRGSPSSPSEAQARQRWHPHAAGGAGLQTPGKLSQKHQAWKPPSLGTNPSHSHFPTVSRSKDKACAARSWERFSVHLVSSFLSPLQLFVVSWAPFSDMGAKASSRGCATAQSSIILRGFLDNIKQSPLSSDSAAILKLCNELQWIRSSLAMN